MSKAPDDPVLAKAFHKKRYAQMKARPRYHETAARYRSDHSAAEILERVKKWKADNPDRAAEMHRNAQKRRRARIAGAPKLETVRTAVVVERDGGRCHLCGRKVATSQITIDHLVPISRGGSHTYDNVALAHMSCNARRGAGRIPAQLRLVG